MCSRQRTGSVLATDPHSVQHLAIGRINALKGGLSRVCRRSVGHVLCVGSNNNKVIANEQYVCLIRSCCQLHKLLYATVER